MLIPIAEIMNGGFISIQIVQNLQKTIQCGQNPILSSVKNMVWIMVMKTNIAAGCKEDCIIFLKHGEAFYQKPSKRQTYFVKEMISFPFNMLILMVMAKQT